MIEVALRTRPPFPPRAEWELRIVNTGRRPVTLRRPVFKLRGAGGRLRLLKWMLPGTIYPFQEFRNPTRLEEQAAETTLLYTGLLDNERLFPGDVIRAGVEDQSGRIWFARRIDGLEHFLLIYSLVAVEEELIGDLRGDRGTYIGRFARKDRHYVVGFCSLSSDRLQEVYIICTDEVAAAGAYKELLQQAAAFRRNERTELSYKVNAGCENGGSGPRPTTQALHWLNFRKVKRSDG